MPKKITQREKEQAAKIKAAIDASGRKYTFFANVVYSGTTLSKQDRKNRIGAMLNGKSRISLDFYVVLHMFGIVNDGERF